MLWLQTNSVHKAIWLPLCRLFVISCIATMAQSSSCTVYLIRHGCREWCKWFYFVLGNVLVSFQCAYSIFIFDYWLPVNSLLCSCSIHSIFDCCESVQLQSKWKNPTCLANNSKSLLALVPFLVFEEGMCVLRCLQHTMDFQRCQALLIKWITTIWFMSSSIGVEVSPWISGILKIGNIYCATENVKLYVNCIWMSRFFEFCRLFWLIECHGSWWYLHFLPFVNGIFFSAFWPIPMFSSNINPWYSILLNLSECCFFFLFARRRPPNWLVILVF